MTVFRKTIFGKILGGLGKVAVAAAPILIPAAGLAVGGAVAAKKTGFFSKIGNIFKKKSGGTVLGNIVPGSITSLAAAGNTYNNESKGLLGGFFRNMLSSAGSAGIAAVGTSIGESAGQFASNLAAKGEGTDGPVAQGFKKGFTGGWVKNNMGIVIAAVIGIGIILYLIFRKKRR